ncbi:MAG: PAS domain-containing protein [Marivibrio sp.]|uniref:PAS domain-containing protein n=1 Tax=Marivibrio sp. TaxID=2039719 RepID=UPI0032EDB9F4
MTEFDAPSSPVPGGELGDIASYHEDDGQGFQLLQDANIRRFAAYWDGLRGVRWAPARKEVDPLAIPWALPHVFIGDYEADSGQFRYRVAGREIEAVFERYRGSSSLKGAALSDILPAEQAAVVARRWGPLATRGAIVYMRGWVYYSAGRAARGERILLPLSDDGTAVSGFLGYTQCRWSSMAEIAEAPHVDIWRLSSGRPEPTL